MSTSFYAGILAIFYVVLAIHVIRGRYKFRVPLGDGGVQQLTQRIRLHANFSEYVPFALLLIYLNEVRGASPVFINIMGCALIGSRFSHAYAINKSHKASRGRFIGMVLTFGILLVAGLRLVMVNIVN